MTPPDFNLFAAEEQLRTRIGALIETPDAPSEALHEALSELLIDYERVVRQLQRLIKLSDRKEEELNRLNRQLVELTEQLEYQALHDGLTGALNKSAITEVLIDQLHDADYSLILFDIDFFKRVNDRHGHPAGDAVLRGIAERIRTQLDDDLLFGRFGGEEFAVVARNTSLAKATELADQMRLCIVEAPFSTENALVPISISLGLTRSVPGEPFSVIYSRADEALYRAKQNGRNCVVASEPPTN